MDLACDGALEIEPHVHDVLRDGDGVSVFVRGQIIAAGLHRHGDLQLLAVELHGADGGGIEAAQGNGHIGEPRPAGHPGVYLDAAQGDGDRLDRGGSAVQPLIIRGRLCGFRRGQLDLADGGLAVVGYQIAHHRAAHQIDRGQIEAAVLHGHPAAQRRHDDDVLNGDGVAGVVLAGEVQGGGVGAAGEAVIGVVRRAAVHAEGDHVVRGHDPRVEPEGAAGIDGRVVRQGPGGNVAAVLRRGGQVDELIGEHAGLHGVVPVAAGDGAGRRLGQDALCRVQVRQVALGHADLDDVALIAEHLPELIVVLGQGPGGLVVLVRIVVGDVVGAVGLTGEGSGGAGLAALVAHAHGAQAFVCALDGGILHKGELVAVVEGVGAGGEYAAGGLFRLRLRRVELDIVDLDLIAAVHAAVALFPHGIEAEPVRPALPGGLGDGGALVGVDGPDVLLGDVDEVGVPLAVLLQVDMDAVFGVGAGAVEPAVQLDGLRAAEVPGPHRGPLQIGGGSGRVDGDIGVAAGGGEGIVVVAVRVRFSCPGHGVFAVRAHFGVHPLVCAEVPAQGGLALEGNAAVARIPDLHGDVLHIAEDRPHVDGAGVGAAALLPGDVTAVGQGIDGGLAELHVHRAGLAVDGAEGHGAAVGSHRHQPRQTGPLLRAEAGDGEIIARPVGVPGLHGGVQDGGLVVFQNLGVRHALVVQQHGVLKVHGELALDGLNGIEGEVRIAVAEAVVHLVAPVLEAEIGRSLFRPVIDVLGQVVLGGAVAVLVVIQVGPLAVLPLPDDELDLGIPGVDLEADVDAVPGIVPGSRKVDVLAAALVDLGLHEDGAVVLELDPVRFLVHAVLHIPGVAQAVGVLGRQQLGFALGGRNDHAGRARSDGNAAGLA